MEQVLEPNYHAKNIVLDGDNHVIGGFTVTNALFQSVKNSQIKNLVFDDITVIADAEKPAQELSVLAGTINMGAAIATIHNFYVA